MRPELVSIRLADPPERWEALGFRVGPDDHVGSHQCDMGVNCSRQSHAGTCELGRVRLRLGCPGEGITGWTLTGIPADTASIDGLQTDLADHSARPTAANHPNGARALDHVVVATPDFDRTAAALEVAGLSLRRVVSRSNGTRMGFRRLGPAILELVQVDGAEQGPARFWGLVVVVQDLEALADRLGERLGSIRDAVQPGRRIATLRESAGLREAVAFMTPESAP